MRVEQRGHISAVPPPEAETTLAFEPSQSLHGGRWAPAREIAGWFKVSLLIAISMLLGVVVAAQLLPVDPNPARNSILLDSTPEFLDAQLVFLRNLLVLAIHFCACYVGAIIGRPHVPLTGRLRVFGFMHRELPRWAARGALIYAFCATTLSVALQTTGLSFILLDISSAVGVRPWQLVLLVLPHALPELVAVFLPLGLFLIQARRKQLLPLGAWARQSAYIALPIIAVSALLEVYLAPNLIYLAATSW